MLTLAHPDGSDIIVSDADTPTVRAINRALAAPTPILRYLAPGAVYNLNDVLELPNSVVIIGYSVPPLSPGQPVREYDVRLGAPRRYSA